MKESCKHPQEILQCQNYNEFAEYEDYIYETFHKKYILSQLIFNNKVIRPKYYPPEYNEKTFFYHLTCENYDHTNDEKDRIPNLRRYEKINWAYYILTVCLSCSTLLIWENSRGTHKNVVLYCEDLEYVVILGVRKEYYLFITAYPIEYENAKKKLLKEYHEYIKKQTTPSI